MIEAWCNNCGARFMADEAMGGKKAKCARCKTIITIPESSPFIADDPEVDLYDADDYDDIPLEAEAFIEAENGEDTPISLDMAKQQEQFEKISSQPMTYDDDPRSFWRQLPGCFVFAIKWPNIVSTIIISFIGLFLFAVPIIAHMMCVIYIFCFGAWCFLLFCIIQGTCNNEDRLVTMFTGCDYLDAAKALGGMLFSFFWSMLPVATILLPLVLWVLPHPIPPATQAAIFTIGSAAWCFIWPMVLLTIALYGVDLPMLWYVTIFRQINKTFGKYTVMSLLVTGCFLATSAISAINPDHFATLFVYGIVRISSVTYISFTAMRIIGVYYRTCKTKLEL